MLRQGAGLLAQAAAAAAAPAAPGAAAAAAAAPALAAAAGRAFSAAADGGKITATLFPGDGIGPDIADAVREIFEAAKAPIEWDEQHLGKTVDERTNSFVTRENLDSVLKHGIGLKGPMTTPIGKGFRSLNLTLRKELQLYANVRPCFSLQGYKTRYDNVNLVTIRENTEGEYSGLEHEVVKGVVESLKVITRTASTRVAEFAFKYAEENNRHMVSAIHKANIMKKADGLFIECCRSVADKYPNIKYEEVIVDNACMQLVRDPSRFDVLCMPNLYGDIVSDLCAGLIGGLGLTPSANVGANGLALMEAVHGTAPDIAGKNLANPTALLLSGCMMLRHLGLNSHADQIQNAALAVIAEGTYRTRDLGGTAGTSDFVKAVIGKL
ncbi:isocitrate dehydrogenase catalytic subunit mitochondrial-like [Raphidocelis subcapitata]|uniref:Isocitrate dehydrogenase catalytic subunit mitochondrial-like n=1 Tax=Raphidocelis subcapitata TaxID=307507 RepID=A0A2V0PQ33_9CHLO|nr:isocitrate dehydrogenase catalytic subunit mitochondrial-like [Raphidocelis subcapitata]|eukprot:GBG00171.1 isocitrate dehydrogenase catalytic subunit mitochondrial-like [Raphidocelis subcapitata]